MPNEIELKLRIAQADIARLRRHAAIKQHLVGKPATRRLVSIYYDTPDLKLLDASISLRVRHMSGGWFQAVKSAGSSIGGLHQRLEWEDIIAKGEPDFSKITEPGLAALFADQQLREALHPVFTTDVRRTEWQLEYQDGSSIEVALDLGELRCNGKGAARPAERIEELEIELKHGKASHVFALALALQAEIPLHIENVSKAQRGYAFYRALQMPAPAQAVTLPAGVGLRKAFRLLAVHCLQHIQHSQERLLSGERSAASAMDLAWQQLAFVLKLFKRKHTPLRELHWIAAKLTAVADWQIFIERILPAAEHELTLPLDQDGLQRRAQAAYERAWTKLLWALHSQRYQRLLLNVGKKMADDGLPADKKAWPLIQRNFQRRYEKFKSQEPDLLHSNFKAAHRLWAKASELGYSAGLLSGMEAPDDKTLQYHQQLTDAEQSLNALQQALLAEILAKRLLRGRLDDGTLQALGALSQWSTQRTAQAAIGADASWQALVGK
ncbi:MAG TPA: CYTH and CHAD domain-containing protein [Methylophilaceae bacterium]|nr:CYTH and CHAD domain-containing protein [Methylophilaceae bacterium]